MLVRFGSDLVAAVLLCGWNGEDTSSRMLSAVSVGLHYLIGVRNYSWYTANMGGGAELCYENREVQYR